jgi:hypothetical protein
MRKHKVSEAKRKRLALKKTKRGQSAKEKKERKPKGPALARCPLVSVRDGNILMIRDLQERGLITKGLADIPVKAKIVCAFELIKAFETGKRISGIGPKRAPELLALWERLKIN